jgi:3-oxoacyl-[acyl-carrier-protein] synthase III
MEVTAAMAASILMILDMPVRQDATDNGAPCLGLALIGGSLVWGTLGAVLVLLLF